MRHYGEIALFLAVLMVVGLSAPSYMKMNREPRCRPAQCENMYAALPTLSACVRFHLDDLGDVKAARTEDAVKPG